MKRWPLLASFLLFLLLCASVAYWGLQVFKPPLRPVAAPPRNAGPDVPPDAAAALFGGRPGKVAVASNYQLRGVILSGTAADSIAILSADGKPAQAVRVGNELQPGVTVKEVHRDHALLSEGGTVKRVELPENAPSGQLALTPAPVNTARPPVQRAVPPAPAPTPAPAPQTAMPAPAVVVNPAATNNPAVPPAPAVNTATSGATGAPAVAGQPVPAQPTPQAPAGAPQQPIQPLPNPAAPSVGPAAVPTGRGLLGPNAPGQTPGQ